MNFKQIENVLTVNGWTLVRTFGFSRQYRKIGCEKAVVLTNHGRETIPMGAVKNLEQATGLSFER